MSKKENNKNTYSEDSLDPELEETEDLTDDGTDDIDTLLLTLEDDREVECQIIDIFSFKAKDYISLLPVNEDADALLLYEYEESDNEEEVVLSMIESEEEFNQVAEAYYALLQSDFEEMADSQDLQED